MSKRNLGGALIILLFSLITGLLFFCDVKSAEQPARMQTSEEPIVSGQEQSDPLAALQQAASDTEQDESREAFSENTEQMIYVYVCGQVNDPGVYSFPPDARVFEAIEAAGGISKKAEPEQLNMASLLHDGDKIYVPAKGEGGNTAADGTASEKTAFGQQIININTADSEQLQTLPGIGESKADDIISYREKNGPFTSTEDIMKIPGIKQGVYEKVRDRISVQ